MGETGVETGASVSLVSTGQEVEVRGDAMIGTDMSETTRRDEMMGGGEVERSIERIGITGLEGSSELQAAGPSDRKTMVLPATSHQKSHPEQGIVLLRLTL